MPHPVSGYASVEYHAARVACMSTAGNIMPNSERELWNQSDAGRVEGEFGQKPTFAGHVDQMWFIISL